MNHRGTERTETIAKVKEKRFFSLGDLCVSVVNVIFLEPLSVECKTGEGGCHMINSKRGRLALVFNSTRGNQHSALSLLFIIHHSSFIVEI